VRRHRPEGQDQRRVRPPLQLSSSSCNPVLLGERRCAAIPDPITAATSSPVPRASAVILREPAVHSATTELPAGISTSARTV
jgi:hypothetical protein